MNPAIRARLEASMFQPGPLGILLNPFYIARAGLWRAVERQAPGFSGRILDLGCGSKPYRDLFTVDSYVGLDVSSRGTDSTNLPDVLYDGFRLPFRDSCFDGVVCSQVLEHVRDPDRVLRETVRVLRPGGLVLVTVPFAWDEHEQPEDYRRFTSFGLRALVEGHGLAIVAQQKISSDLGAVFQLANVYLYKLTVTLPKWLRVLVRPLLTAPVTVVGLIAARWLPDNEDLYLDQLVLVRK